MAADQNPTLVIDMGSFRTRAGLAGDDEPTIETVTALSINNTDANVDDMVPGADSLLMYPLVGGVFSDATAVEKIWHRVIYNGIKTDPSNHSLLISEHELIPASNREQMAQMCFETFNFKSMVMKPKSILSLYCSGRLTGLSVTIGHDTTRIVPIYEGQPIIHGMTKADFGGKHLTSYFGKLLNEAGYPLFDSDEGRFCLRRMTEAHSYVTLDCQQEITCNYDRYWSGWEMPHGEYINYGPERCKVGEALFDPSQLGIDSPGLADLVFQTIEKCPEELRQELQKNIVISGGVGKMSGIAERLRQDLQRLVANTNYTEVKATKLPEANHSAWIGGSIFGSLSVYETTAMTLEDYNEDGPKGIHRYFMSHVDTKK